jgi:Fur family transcriptional regulator, peroxide stress response regulator
MVNKTAVRLLTEKGLKVTPQRIAVLDVILTMGAHPTADEISDYLRLNLPNMTIGTVHKILSALLEKGIITRVKTENGLIRYDAVMEKHHHLYCPELDQIEDYFDPALTKILEDHFRKKSIPGFIITDFNLQVIGKFSDKAEK